MTEESRMEPDVFQYRLALADQLCKGLLHNCNTLIKSLQNTSSLKEIYRWKSCTNEKMYMSSAMLLEIVLVVVCRDYHLCAVR